MRYLVVLAACGLLGVAQAAAATDTTPFTFAPAALDVTCADLAKGTPVQVTNTTAAEQTLTLALTPTHGAIATACGGLATKSAPATVAPGDTVAFTLAGTSSKDVPAPLSGSLVAYGTSGLAASLALTISPAGPTGPATPLVASAAGTQYREHGTTPIWVPVDLGAKSQADFEPKQILGAVVGNGTASPVTYAGTKTHDGVSMVGLDVGELPSGSYTGKVDLLPADPTKGDVALTLTVKDWWLLVLAVLLLSIVLAFFVQRMIGVLIPRRKLDAAAGATGKTYEAMKAALASAPGNGAWKQSTLTDVPARIDALTTDIAAKTAGAFVSIDDKVVQALQNSIDALDTSVKRLGELPKAAAGLEAALEKFDEGVATSPPPPPNGGKEPALVGAARAQLAAHAVAVDDLPALLQAIADATDAVATIVNERGYVVKLQHDIDMLTGKLAGNDKALKALADARTKLNGLWVQLFNNTDLDYLDTLETGLHTIDGGLSELWPSHAVNEVVCVSRAAQPPSTQRFFLEDAVVGPVDQEIQRAEAAASAAQWLELLALAVGLTLAVVAGMTALYIGKPFGSFWDYVTLVTWGLATPTALAAAGTALNNLGALSALGQRLRA